VYVEINDEVQRFYDELPRRFLHFSADPAQVKKWFLPKADRNLNGSRTAMIYRAGVFVREVEECSDESVYDYNFKPDELPIDECRNSSNYAIKAAIAKLYRKASALELVPVFKTLIEQRPTFEASLDPYYICPSYETPKPEQQQAWQQAWQAVAADAVMCGPSITLADFVRKKGHDAKIIRAPGIVEVAARFGIKTDSKVLTENEQKGREKLPASPAAQAAVDEVWGWLTNWNMTNGKEKPPVGCFHDVMNGGSRTFGFCDDTGVYIADDQASDWSKPLLKTALEEVTHWTTGATDLSRDFQDFLLRLVVEFAA
jgi:hypothetical protein